MTLVSGLHMHWHSLAHMCTHVHTDKHAHKYTQIIIKIGLVPGLGKYHAKSPGLAIS